MERILVGTKSRNPADSSKTIPRQLIADKHLLFDNTVPSELTLPPEQAAGFAGHDMGKTFLSRTQESR